MALINTQKTYNGKLFKITAIVYASDISLSAPDLIDSENRHVRRWN
jgi:hypothetical protein